MSSELLRSAVLRRWGTRCLIQVVRSNLGVDLQHRMCSSMLSMEASLLLLPSTMVATRALSRDTILNSSLQRRQLPMAMLLLLH